MIKLTKFDKIILPILFLLLIMSICNVIYYDNTDCGVEIVECSDPNGYKIVGSECEKELDCPYEKFWQAFLIIGIVLAFIAIMLNVVYRQSRW